jgi:hypothetical protein
MLASRTTNVCIVVSSSSAFWSLVLVIVDNILKTRDHFFVYNSQESFIPLLPRLWSCHPRYCYPPSW